MRVVFYFISVFGITAVYILYLMRFYELAEVCFYLICVYIAIGVYDILQKKHTILRLYPVIGHLRYMLEYIRPEIQQYFIASDKNERPFSRELRSIVYQRAKGELDTIPFGTKHDIGDPGYDFIQHSLNATKLPKEETRVLIGGPSCKLPYSASIMNISAMSFGALSQNAIIALNKGASRGNFYHNTGEGGLTKYHLHGGDLCFQIGTAYFGCRTRGGGFDSEMFQKKAKLESVKMIEIKLSQGAKPSHGGILPKEKITEEIAEFRGVNMGEDCESPPTHTEFNNPVGLLEFVKKLRDLSGGKPVGFKLCIGKKSEFMSICKAMVKTKIMPDFITVDGAEGGTGAAPLEFSNRLGMTIDEAIIFVHNCLVGVNMRKQIKVIASGKVITGFHLLHKIAIGADLCNSARGMMFALGCVQSLSCNTNACPTGVATQSKYRSWALNVEDKYKRVANYHDSTLKSFIEIVGAMGISSISNLTPDLVYRRGEKRQSNSYADLHAYIATGNLLSKSVHKDYIDEWNKASVDAF